MESDLPVIELEGQVKIRIAHPPVEVRYAGGGLESFIFEYRGRQRKGLIARAVLAFQRANGSSIPPLPALTYLMDQHDLSRADLAPLLGTPVG